MSLVGNFPTLDHTYENGTRNIVSLTRALQDTALANQQLAQTRITSATPHGRDWAAAGKLAGLAVGTVGTIATGALSFAWDTIGDSFRDYGRSRWSPLLHTAVCAVGGGLAGAGILGATIAFGGVASATILGAAATGALYGMASYGIARGVVKVAQAWVSTATICASKGARAGANIGDFISNVSDTAFAGWRRNTI